MPERWTRGHFTPAQPKELVRSLIRRIMVTRPVPDTVEAKVVWVSGAATPLQVHPPMLRQTDVGGDEAFVTRVLALGAVGYQDREMARRFTAEGFRSARRDRMPVTLVGERRRARGHISLIAQLKTQATREGQGTVFGFAQELDVHRHWRYTRIRHGSLPANRHPVTGHDLMPDAPEVWARLRAHRARCCYREEGTVMAWRRPICSI